MSRDDLQLMMRGAQSARTLAAAVHMVLARHIPDDVMNKEAQTGLALEVVDCIIQDACRMHLIEANLYLARNGWRVADVVEYRSTDE